MKPAKKYNNIKWQYRGTQWNTAEHSGMRESVLGVCWELCVCVCVRVRPLSPTGGRAREMRWTP